MSQTTSSVVPATASHARSVGVSPAVSKNASPPTSPCGTGDEAMSIAIIKPKLIFYHFNNICIYTDFLFARSLSLYWTFANFCSSVDTIMSTFTRYFPGDSAVVAPLLENSPTSRPQNSRLVQAPPGAKTNFCPCLRLTHVQCLILRLLLTAFYDLWLLVNPKRRIALSYMFQTHLLFCLKL